MPSDPAVQGNARERGIVAPPRTEEEWIESQEQAARKNIRRCTLALGRDLARAVHLPRGTREHPLVRLSLERAGDALGSDLVLDRVESFGAHAVAASRGVERTKFTTAALAIFQAIGK
jgi:hypothetical protein